MGAVWLADHLALKTQVAVKFILAGRENDSEARERFSREAEAAAQVKSPHVAQIFDHGVAEDGVPFIVMELLEGEDLARYVQANGRLGLREAASVITQTCRALQRAHAKGLIHRDVKPANIFLCDVGTPERFVKLLDFGVAKVVGDNNSQTKSGAVTGTPVYMAPEQLLGAKDLDHRADLWSVAVVAYELMTGRRPFIEETAAAIALRVHTRGMPAASEGMTELSPSAAQAIDEWFAKGWALHPGSRFESATELSETFEALVRKLYQAEGVESARQLVIQVDRISLPGERNEMTIREKPAVSSDVTLQSGRTELPSKPTPPVSRSGPSSKVVIQASASTAPHTETPISRQVRESNAPAPATEPPRRARYMAVVALALAAVASIALLVLPRGPQSAVPLSPASSPSPVVTQPVPSVTIATSPSPASPSVVTTTTASATPSVTATATATVKKGTVAPVKSAASTAASVKKPLEDIE
jgi:eukaryotic-like serine/threonine-protein kinase